LIEVENLAMSDTYYVDSIFKAVNSEGFHIKAKCKASMKKDLQSIDGQARD